MVLLIAVHLHQLRVAHGARTQLGTVYWASSRIGKDAADERAELEAAAEKASSDACRMVSAAVAAAEVMPFDEAGDAAFLGVLNAAVAAAEAADVAASADGVDGGESSDSEDVGESSDSEDDGFNRRRRGKRRLQATKSRRQPAAKRSNLNK